MNELTWGGNPLGGWSKGRIICWRRLSTIAQSSELAIRFASFDLCQRMSFFDSSYPYSSLPLRTSPSHQPSVPLGTANPESVLSRGNWNQRLRDWIARQQIARDLFSASECQSIRTTRVISSLIGFWFLKLIQTREFCLKVARKERPKPFAISHQAIFYLAFRNLCFFLLSRWKD